MDDFEDQEVRRVRRHPSRLDQLLEETAAWNRAYIEIIEALDRNPVAVAKNAAEVARLRHMEEEGEEWVQWEPE